MNTQIVINQETGLACQNLASSLDEIFKPLEPNSLKTLFTEYSSDRQKLETIADAFGEDNKHIIDFFLKGNAPDRQLLSPAALFERERAIKALDAHYWQQALDMTDILEMMPQKRKSEWHDYIRELKTPPFDEATVLATLQDLMLQRPKFFAERVDGIFNALSPDHLTNRPEGFSKRMILNYVYHNGYPEWRQCGYIHDLRCVIAKFMGRQDPLTTTTTDAIRYARLEHCGKWVLVDGGALKLRLYKKGTAHLEVHPEMAWRLNMVLAYLYPNAIPDKHRRPPRRSSPKEYKLYNRPLPFPVLEVLSQGSKASREFTFQWDIDTTTQAYVEACDVLTILGGIKQDNTTYIFSYDYSQALKSVCISGVLPDQKVHQYYPTPRWLAKQVSAIADIQEGHSVLEPSAGQGALAEFLPKGSMLVEVSPLHCEILRAKGHENVIEADFLRWSTRKRFDRIVMNPPFTKGQWKRHLERASDFLGANGKLVAILPAGAASRKDLLPGWNCVWGDPIPFPGTSIEIRILVATHN